MDIRLAVKNARGATSDLERVRKRGVKPLGTEAYRTGRKARVAGRRLGAMGKAAHFSGKRMRGAVGGAVALLGAYAGFTAMKGAVTTTLDFTKATVGLQKATGLETDAAAKWIGLAKVRGIEGKALNMGMVTLAANMRKARDEGSDQARIFDQLGVSSEAIQKRDLPRTLLEMADGLKSMRSESEQAAVGKGLLGRGFATMLPLIRGGSKELHDMMLEANQLGVGMDDLSRDKLMEMVQAQRKVQLGALGLKLAFTKWAAPGLLEFQKAGVAAMKVLNDPSLTGEQKMDKLMEMGERMGEKIGDGMERARFGEHIADAFEQAFPHIAETAGRTGGRFVTSFAKGWWKADPASQIFVASLLLAKLGVFSALGGGAAKMFIARFAPRLAAAMGVSMAAEGAVGAAATSPTRWKGLGGKAGKSFARGFGPAFAAFVALEYGDDILDAIDRATGSGDNSKGEDSNVRKLLGAGPATLLFPQDTASNNNRGTNTGLPKSEWRQYNRGSGLPPGSRRGGPMANSGSRRAGRPRASGSGVSPEVVVPMVVKIGERVVGEATGRAMLRDEALTGASGYGD